VLRMRGTIDRETPWDVPVDLFFYRDPEELEKQEEAAPVYEEPTPTVPVVDTLEQVAPPIPQAEGWESTAPNTTTAGWEGAASTTASWN
jgi:small subunit ribosomal protein SAe